MMSKTPVHHYNGTNVSSPQISRTVMILYDKYCMLVATFSLASQILLAGLAQRRSLVTDFGG